MKTTTPPGTARGLALHSPLFFTCVSPPRVSDLSTRPTPQLQVELGLASVPEGEQSDLRQARRLDAASTTITLAALPTTTLEADPTPPVLPSLHRPYTTPAPTPTPPLHYPDYRRPAPSPRLSRGRRLRAGAPRSSRPWASRPSPPPRRFPRPCFPRPLSRRPRLRRPRRYRRRSAWRRRRLPTGSARQKVLVVVSMSSR